MDGAWCWKIQCSLFSRARRKVVSAAQASTSSCQFSSRACYHTMRQLSRAGWAGVKWLERAEDCSPADTSRSQQHEAAHFPPARAHSIWHPASSRLISSLVWLYLNSLKPATTALYSPEVMKNAYYIREFERSEVASNRSHSGVGSVCSEQDGSLRKRRKVCLRTTKKCS